MQPDSLIALVLGGFAILFFIVMIGLMIATLFWAYSDAEERGKPGCIVVLLIFFLGWPLSLLAWVIFRPDKRIQY